MSQLGAGPGRPEPAQVPGPTPDASTRGRAAFGQQGRGGAGPGVVPGGSQRGGAPSIAAGADPAAGAERRRPTAEELDHWSKFFLDAEETPTPRELLEVVVRLKKDYRMAEVEAAIRGYLQKRPEGREQPARAPWMYEMLAVALEYNQADAARALEALGYAAILAGRPGDEGEPGSLLTVADMMVMRNAFEVTVPVADGDRTIRVGELLDLAAERRPDLPEPLTRSMELAEMQLDGERMAGAAEGLLSIGWPGVDATWRAEVRDRVLGLAERLRDRGRAEEADRLIVRLDAAEPRDVYARLTWEGYGDLDFEVDEPLGATATLTAPRTVFGGALVKNGIGSDPEDVYVCPRGFDGPYTFRVKLIASDPKEPITAATLRVVTHEGGPDEQVQTFAIDPEKPEPVTVELTGGRRREALPYVVPKIMVMQPGPPESPSAEAAGGPAATLGGP